MAQNLVVDGKTFYGVDYIGMLNAEGKEIQYHEKTNVGTGVVVAIIGEKEYYTVEDALAEAQSGETVSMTADSTEDVDIIIPDGVTLHLQSYTLTVNRLIGFSGGKLNATTAGAGKLKVAKDKLLLSEAAVSGNFTIVPLWNPESNHYEFAQMMVRDTLTGHGLTIVEGENESIGFKFRTAVEPYYRTRLLNDGGSDNGLSVFVELAWSKEQSKASLHFDYANATVASVFGSTNTDYYFTQTNYSAFDLDIETLEARGVVKLECGIELATRTFSKE